MAQLLVVLPLCVGAAFVFAALSCLRDLKAAGYKVGPGRRGELHSAFNAFGAAVGLAGVLVMVCPVVVKLIVAAGLLATAAAGWRIMRTPLTAGAEPLGTEEP